MYRPEIVSPGGLALSLAEAKQHLNVDYDDEDAEITALIKSAQVYYEGWSGILGICIAEQTVLQAYDDFTCLTLPLGPVQAADMAVKWRDSAGTEATIDAANYVLRVDAGGRASVAFVRGYNTPSNLYATAPVSVTYKAGWAANAVPEDLKTAIKLQVQMLYDEAARANAATLQRIETMLVAKYRRYLV